MRGRRIGTSLQSLRQQIDALPEPDRSKRRAFYTDEEWEHAWELNARPFQIRPESPDSRIWSIIGGRRVGKSWAGEHYVIENYVEEHKSVLGVFYHQQAMMKSFQPLFQYTEMFAGEFETKREGDAIISMKDLRLGTGLLFMTESSWAKRGTRGQRWDFIWGDEVTNAIPIVEQNHMTPEFLFTEPAKLHPDTLVSRAGDGRTY